MPADEQTSTAPLCHPFPAARVCGPSATRHLTDAMMGGRGGGGAPRCSKVTRRGRLQPPPAGLTAFLALPPSVGAGSRGSLEDSRLGTDVATFRAVSGRRVGVSVRVWTAGSCLLPDPCLGPPPHPPARTGPGGPESCSPRPHSRGPGAGVESTGKEKPGRTPGPWRRHPGLSSALSHRGPQPSRKGLSAPGRGGAQAAADAPRRRHRWLPPHAVCCQHPSTGLPAGDAPESKGEGLPVPAEATVVGPLSSRPPPRAQAGPEHVPTRVLRPEVVAQW